jgi:hypothetical protein
VNADAEVAVLVALLCALAVAVAMIAAVYEEAGDE